MNTQTLTPLSATATNADRVPFIRLDAAYPELFVELMEVIERVGRDAAFTLGPEVADFEEQFAAECGTRYAIGVSSGTAALALVLRAMGIGPGDEVIVPTYTFIATAEAVSAVGAKPVLVDVDPDTACITAEIVEAALTERTRAVIPVHLFGRTVDMDPILALCRPRGIKVVEDACQAHSAQYRGRPVGSIGDAGCFSFYPTKNLGAYGDGGGVVTDDGELARRLRLLRDYGRTAENCHEIVAGNSRFDELQAAILRVKLARLDGWNDTRRRLASIYAERLADLPLELPVAEDRGEHVYHLYVVRTPRRDELQAHLRANGVGAGVHYPQPVHLQPAWKGRPLEWPLPATEKCVEEILSLPMYPELSEGDVEHVADLVRGFFR